VRQSLPCIQNFSLFSANHWTRHEAADTDSAILISTVATPECGTFQGGDKWVRNCGEMVIGWGRNKDMFPSVSLFTINLTKSVLELNLVLLGGKPTL
jgi:hypothetical protein